MVTLRAPVHVEEATVKRLAAELGCSEQAALRKIKALLPSAVNDLFAWRRFVVQDGEVKLVHGDDLP